MKQRIGSIVTWVGHTYPGRLIGEFGSTQAGNYASGLALYWTVGNFISIIQQSVMNRTSMGQEMRAIAARRAAKRGAKTINARR